MAASEATDDTAVPHLHREPRFDRKLVKVTRQRPRAGVRFHTGFMADEWRDAAKVVGFDLGAYVAETREDGSVDEMLRGASPIAAVQWEITRELKARNDALTAEVAEMSGRLAALEAAIKGQPAA